MAQTVFRRPIWWTEPAHPGIVQQLSDLENLYRAIRATVQPKIDDAFDEVSRQIGFVVATTLPVAVRVNDKNQVTDVSVRGEQYKGTLFEGALNRALTPLKERPIGEVCKGATVGAGTYNLYAIWQSALSLVLQHHWLEPAHPGITTLAAEELQLPRSKRPPGVHEPAHFLDAAFELTAEDTIAIAAIDKVYPELQLAERIAAVRTATRPVAVSAYVKEPPHFRPSTLLENDSFVAALRELMQKFSG